jgi:NitT/TauT family transport system permease protein
LQSNALRRHAPFWFSLFAGIALWEIAGRNSSPAFMVPFSTTIVRLWQLTVGGNFILNWPIRRNSSFAGFGLALIVGMPLGLLFARVRILRIGIEPYIMILYATPMVALIPFILSMMGFGFAPKLLVVFLFAVFPVLYNTVEGARSIKPELIEVAKVIPLERVGAVARGHVALHVTLHMTGVRQAIGRALVGMIAAGIFPVGNRPRSTHHECFAEFRYRRRVRVNPGHRSARCCSDPARPGHRAAFRALETVAWPNKLSAQPLWPIRKRRARRADCPAPGCRG